MSVKIIIHIFPHEMENYERVIEQLNVSSYGLSINEIEIKTCLTINPIIIKESNSDKIKKIRNKFVSITNLSVFKTSSTISEEYFGVNEHRRNSIENSSNTDYLIFLDSDIHFNKDLLKIHKKHYDTISKKYEFFILTPQYTKLWDNTWDELVNTKFLNKARNEIKPNVVNDIYGDMGLREIRNFKWAGGWFTGISGSLAKKISIPKSFVGYGPDDTFMMECCKILKQKKINVIQYCIRGMIVYEQNSFKQTSLREDIPTFRKNCNQVFYRELNAFTKSLNI